MSTTLGLLHAHGMRVRQFGRDPIQTQTASPAFGRPVLRKAPRPRRHSYIDIKAVSGYGMERASSSKPLQLLRHTALAAATWASKLMADGLRLVVQLIRLLRRMHLAAEHIKASAAMREKMERREKKPMMAEEGTKKDTAPLPNLSSAAQKAVRMLRSTLTDTTGTLESKCMVLESATGERMQGLFTATRDAAEVIGSVELVRMGRTAAAIAARRRAEECATAIRQEEEALRAAVFAHVLAELRENKAKNPSSLYQRRS